jgi:regulator of sirC expression with transglutaminase-like and TPR domain
VTTLLPGLQDILAGRPSPLELDQAALEIARLHNPATDSAAALATLDLWADEIASTLPPAAGGMQYLGAAGRFLFGDAGLRGDQETYFAPENSCLDQVLIRRKGLPLTLSIIYIEVARRLLRPVHGIALPGHFLCQYNDGLVNVFVDVFHQGKLLTPADALALAESVTGQPMDFDPALFQPASPRSILRRMLHNLRNAYLQARDGDRLRALDALIFPGT